MREWREPAVVEPSCLIGCRRMLEAAVISEDARCIGRVAVKSAWAMVMMSCLGFRAHGNGHGRKHAPALDPALFPMEQAYVDSRIVEGCAKGRTAIGAEITMSRIGDIRPWP